MAKYGEPLKTDIYKPYIQSGPYIQFVVWPCLLLHKDGPLLAKGVAQGTGGARAAWSDDKRHNVPKKTSEFVDAGLTFGHNGSYNYNENKHLSQSKKKLVDRPSSYPYDSFDVRESHRQTRSNRDYYGDNDYKSLPTKTEYEDEPSVSDIKLFFRYIDRSDFTGAKNVLGDKKYSKCWGRMNERYCKFI
jgi:hypothetical protein